MKPNSIKCEGLVPYTSLQFEIKLQEIPSGLGVGGLGGDGVGGRGGGRPLTMQRM